MSDSMFPRMARFVVRPGDPEDGLIIGALMKGNTFFKQGKVYEITEVCGDGLDVPAVVKQVKSRLKEFGKEATV